MSKFTFNVDGEINETQKTKIKKIPKFRDYLKYANELGATGVNITATKSGKYTKIFAEVIGLDYPGYFLVVVGVRGGIISPPTKFSALRNLIVA